MSLKPFKSERARENCRKHRRTYNKKYYSRTTYLYKGRKWTKEEDDLVFDHTYTDTELSSVINRSVGAIQNRRNKLKKLYSEKELEDEFKRL